MGIPVPTICPSSASTEALLTLFVTKLGQNDFENPVQIVLMIRMNFSRYFNTISKYHFNKLVLSNSYRILSASRMSTESSLSAS